LVRPEFLRHNPKEQTLLIDALAYYLECNGSFDRVFLNLDAYFDQKVKDQRKFMRVLLVSLMKYKAQSQNS